MDYSSGATITIDRTYFETICRRANFKNGADDANRAFPADSVVIVKSQYAELMRVAHQYNNLKRNLVNGGVSEETIALLSGDDSTWESPEDHATPSSGVLAVDSSAKPLNGYGQRTYSSNPQYRPTVYRDHDGQFFQAHDGHDGDLGDPVHDAPEWPEPAPSGEIEAQPSLPKYERLATRTILISNLADGTTLADITAVVRGGQLLDIYIRGHERWAQVSFLNGDDARRFFDHVRRWDLYIRQKRVEVKWADRQFVLPGHIATKIGQGASRNLIIRRCDGRHTEESIRDDLEHIHNLAVVDIKFVGGSCFVSINSVHNAMFARTCMMSRHKYRGSKIEWGIDECAQPLEQPLSMRKEPQKLPSKRSMNPVANRFQLLGIDGDVDDDDSDEESDASSSATNGGASFRA